MTKKRPAAPKVAGKPATGPVVRYTFPDGSIERVPVVDVLAKLYRGTATILRAKREAEEARANQAREAAKNPRPTPRMLAIQRKYKKLTKDGYDDRDARLKIERDSEGKWDYRTVLRAVKKLGQ